MHSTHFIFLSLACAALNVPFRKEFGYTSSILKRDAYAQDIPSNGLSFIATLALGTPPQEIQVVLDTGSSDLWVATPGTCNTDANGITTEPNYSPIDCRYTYDQSKSSSIQQLNIPFEIQYGDLSTSTGSYALDTLQIGGASVPNIEFAYATQTNSTPVFGIGFQLGEACETWRRGPNNTVVLGPDSCKPYANVPIQLKNQGLIASTAYSIWLNDLNSRSGQVLFGGVDSAKYHNQLSSLPIEAEPALYYKDGTPTLFFPKYTRTLVTLNQVNLYPGDGTSDILIQGALPALLDTGSTQCSMPPIVLDALASTMNSKEDGYGGYFVDCGVSDDATIGFNFRGIEIEVPLGQFLRPELDWYGNELVDEETGFRYCSLGISTSIDDTFIILGDNVLSSFYAVFDLEHGEIALAPAVYNQKESNSQDIGGSIPAAVKAPYYDYNFTSTMDINTAPTVTFAVSAITSLPGDVASYDAIPSLTYTANGELWASKHLEYAVYKVAENATTSAVPSSTDDHLLDDIEGFSITRTLPAGMTTVTNLGRPIYASSATQNSSSASAVATSSGYGTNASSTGTLSGAASGAPTSGSVNSSVPGSASGVPASISSGASGEGSGVLSTVSVIDTAVSTICPECEHVHTTGNGPEINGLDTTVTSEFTAFTTYCPEATTFTVGSDTYTVTEATTLTITDCGCTEKEATDTGASSPTETGSTAADSATTVTDITTVFTTFCPEPTTFTVANNTYTVTSATTLTITFCPTIEPTPEASETPTETSQPAAGPSSEEGGTPAAPPSELPESSEAVPTANKASSVVPGFVSILLMLI